MTTTQAEDRVPRTPLTRERVLRAAMAMVDESGIDALSMRRLARELGVEAMSLYNHVSNKDSLLDGLMDAAAGEIELPSLEAGWRAAIRRSAVSARDMFLRHRWASGLWMSRGTVGPARLRYSDWLLQTLGSAGFSDDLVYHAFHIVEAQILGFSVMQLGILVGDEEAAQMVESFTRQFRPEDYPHMAEHIRQHTDPREGQERGFELGLDLILDGLQRLRDSAGAERA